MTDAPLLVEHQRFGKIQAGTAELIHFSGLPGFPRARRFIVRGHDKGDFFAWLICCDDPQLAFAIVNPWTYVADYEPPLSPRDLALVDHQPGDEMQIIAIARVSPDELQLNLAAPLVVNLRSRKGRQIIPENSSYSTRETFRPVRDTGATQPTPEGGA